MNVSKFTFKLLQTATPPTYC